MEFLQRRLDAAFPAEADHQLIRGVREGILLADEVVHNEPILSNEVGRDLRGHIRRAGISFRLHQLCIAGDIPIAAKMARMPIGNWHWLELNSEDFTAHLCRTVSPGAFPDETPNRQDCRLSNQPSLFDPKILPFRDLGRQVRQLYAWLTFGLWDSGKLRHLCWAMPAADSADWLAHTDILQRTQLAERKVKPEKPSKTLGLKFREHIEQSIVDSDNKSEEE